MGSLSTGRLLAFGLAFLLTAGPANAGFVRTLELETDGTHVTQDYIYFDVIEPTRLPDYFFIAQRGSTSGDGTMRDPYLGLYRDTGALDADSLIAAVDDAGPTPNAFLIPLLPVGSYVVAARNFSAWRAASLEGMDLGFVPFTECAAPSACDPGTYTLEITTIRYVAPKVTTTGDIRVTRLLEGNLDGSFTETVLNVPAPGALLLFGAALLGLVRAMRTSR